ncbi:MAG: hypothetical protein KGS48_19190 [Bacteroidetes bacterium]|nr:hypothetical protein [Bacteroidota bacterium]
MKTKMQHINEYFRQADLAAIRFKRAERSHMELSMRNDLLFQKYGHVFKALIVNNLPFLLIIPAHIVAGIFEGMVLAPVFLEITFDLIPEGWPQQVASYFPIVMFWGITLIIGNVYHRIQSHQDPFDPIKRHFNTPQLLKALVVSLAYVSFLFILAALTLLKPGDNDGLALTMLCLGTAELFLGYFAITGWQILIAYYAQIRNRTGKGLCASAMNRHSHECDQQFSYYLQAITQYKLDTGVEINPKTNRRIQDALKYCESDEFNPPSNPPLMSLEEEFG